MAIVKELTLTEAQSLACSLESSAESFSMDEQAFGTLYERTARPLWSYLYRVSGNDATLADDLVQESYFRLLRVRLPQSDQEYMKNYLFRIATNLLRDHWRRGKIQFIPLHSSADPGTRCEVQPAAPIGSPESIQSRAEVSGVLEKMKPRERELLWLAYAEGSSHREIAAIVGLKEQSVRTMLFRARQKLAGLLRGKGLMTNSE